MNHLDISERPSEKWTDTTSKQALKPSLKSKAKSQGKESQGHSESEMVGNESNNEDDVCRARHADYSEEADGPLYEDMEVQSARYENYMCGERSQNAFKRNVMLYALEPSERHCSGYSDARSFRVLHKRVPETNTAYLIPSDARIHDTIHPKCLATPQDNTTN